MWAVLQFLRILQIVLAFVKTSPLHVSISEHWLLSASPVVLTDHRQRGQRHVGCSTFSPRFHP